MAYNYYRSSAPQTWGTSNYRFGYPPEPTFRPHNTCEPHPTLICRDPRVLTVYVTTGNGLDYYQAHAMNPDP